jgi:AAA+ superfamily predicted ATPase
VEVRNHRVVQIQGKSGRDVQNKLLLTSLYKALEHFNLIER